MKLIIKEYLASLKERDELDAILPDLLSELGLNVISKPSKGTRQYGVDIAAMGCLNSDEEKVYLFSIKAGDLTRASWDGDTPQSLRPSLNEIIDAYIPNNIPQQYKNKPVVICLCFGGDIQEQVRIQIEGYKKQHSNSRIGFEEWNGDKLADLILSMFLRDELFPSDTRSLLRKSIALLEEPQTSYKHFSILVKILANNSTVENKAKDKLKVLRQLNICLWILFTWCREANNLESAYLSSEFTLLHAWEISKPYVNKNTKVAKAITTTFMSILGVYHQICNAFLKKIIPHMDKLHGLSVAVHSSFKVDVNLKLFDILGRIAMAGVWTCLLIQNTKDETIKFSQWSKALSHSIKQIIFNNPLLYSPYKDDQAIDIIIAVWFLAQDVNNHEFIYNWLLELINRIWFNFDTHGNYPCILNGYQELIQHPLETSDAYRKEMTVGSILFPFIAAISGLLGFDDIYEKVQRIKASLLAHCNFQLWYPDEISESHFYTNSTIHGSILSHLPIEKSKEIFLEQIFNECNETDYFDKLSAIEFGKWPILYIACRHFRIPLPVHFLKQIHEIESKRKSQNSVSMNNLNLSKRK
jgi:hypothetical protein